MRFVSIIRLLKIYSIILFSVMCVKVQGEELKIISHQLDRLSALPTNNIRCIAQDEDGFLWLGTLNGLYRFDGYLVQKYARTYTGNRALMKENRVTRLECWKDGQLAVHFFRQGVIGLNTRNGKFEPLRDSLAYIRDFCIGQNLITDNLGNHISLVNGTENILYKNVQTGDTLVLDAVPLFLWKQGTDIKLRVVTDRRGLIWVSTAGGGISVYDGNGNRLKRIMADQPDHLIPSNYITDMIEDREGRILVCEQWYGISILTIEGKKVDVIALGNENDKANAREVKVLAKVPGGKIIVANNMGEAFTIGDDAQLHAFHSLPDDVEYLYITTNDKDGLLAGTRASGLYVNGSFLTHSDGKPSISSNRIDCILTDPKGRIWICNINGMVDMLERKEDEWIFHHFFTQFDGFEVKSMICDHKGKIWMATNIGVIRFNPDNLIKNRDAYTRYPLPMNDEEVRVTCLMEDSKHVIWAGTSGWGVFVCADGKNFVPFGEQRGMTRIINAFVEDTEHNIWMAGEEGALCYSLDNGMAFRLYLEADPLKNIFNSHCAVAMDRGKVMLGSLDGLLVTDRSMLQQTSVEQTLRMSEIEVNGKALPDDNFIKLKHNQNSLTFFFSDLSFDVNRLTYYSYRMDGLDMQWCEPTTANFASFNALAPGHYTFYVKLVAGTGKMHEQSVPFIILVPWWQTWWFRMFMLILLAAIVIRFWVHHHREAKLQQEVHDEHLLMEYKVNFFTNISHEFRTPLTLIQGSMDKILSLSGVSEQLQPSFRLMQRNVTRMRRLIDQFLEFRKMETGNLELRLEQIEMVGMLRDIYLSFRDVSDRRRINYQFSTTEKQLVMYADRGYVDKIAYNLLSNAFKYTPVGGDISMKLAVEEGMLAVTVQDTGIGVPEDKRDKLFNRYNRSKVERNSMGIGLNLTAELVHKHLGTITYQPGEEGGSVFKFTLPVDKSVYKESDFLQESELKLQRERLSHVDWHESRPMLAHPMNDKTVLVVEDDNDILDLLQQELSNYFHVEIAGDGAEAIEILEEKMPDLLVTDIRMPHMDGFQLLKHIRKSSYRYLPVIMLTAVDTAEVALKSIGHGADVYLPKSFDMRILVAHCAALVQKFSDGNAASVQVNGEEARLKKGAVKKEPSEVKTPVLTNGHDRKFLNRFDAYIQNHMEDKNLNIDQLAEAMGYGRSKFYRKVNLLLGCSPKEYIRKMRIERAAELLRSSDTITVSEVAYMTGFNTPQYFSTVFRAYYGMIPSEYQKADA